MKTKGSRSKGFPSKVVLILIPLGVLVTFLMLFRAALVSYLGSVQAWYALLSVVLALLALQMSTLMLQAIAERAGAEAPSWQSILRWLGPHFERLRSWSYRTRRRG